MEITLSNREAEVLIHITEQELEDIINEYLGEGEWSDGWQVQNIKSISNAADDGIDLEVVLS